MKRKANLCKRWLTMVLCLSMVLTSVNVPLNPVTAQAALLGVLVEVSGANINVTLPGNYATYNIYVDDTKVKENVGPAVYTLEQTVAGDHTVKVVGIKDGAEDTVDGVFEQTVTTEAAGVAKPAAPVGFVVNLIPDQAGVVVLAWAADTSVDHYIAKVDGVTASNAMTNGGTLTGFANGSYTISLIAVNAAGVESDAADFAFTVTNGVPESEAAYKPVTGGAGSEGSTEEDTEENTEEDTEDGSGSEGTTSEYINLEEKSQAENGVWTFVDANNSDATFTYDENSVAVKATGWGQQDWWTVQWTVQDIAVTAGKWQVEYDIVSTIDKPVMSKLTNFGVADQDTPIIDEAYNLTANEEKHYSETATIGADGKVRLFFNLAGGTGEGTVTISNVKLTAVNDGAGEVEGGSGNEGEGGENAGDNNGAVTSGYINLEEKSQTENGIWTFVASDASDATFTYDEKAVTVAATSWGQQDWWSVQWTVQDINVTAGDWKVEYDIVSTITKPVLSKLTNFGVADQDTPIIEAKYDLVANEAKHYSETATIGADGKVRLFFNLAGGSGEGTVTISNIKLSPVVEYTYINLEEKSQTENGIWTFVASDASDATFAYDEKAVTVAATSWGQQDWWSVQWTVQDIDVTAGEWQVEYDIVSTIAKPILSKLTSFGEGLDQDTPIVEAKYDLVANETKHYSETAIIAADGKVRLFFNLAGGTGEGTVTISNIMVSPAGEGGNGGETTKAAPALTASRVSKADGYVVGGESPVVNFTDDADWRAAVTAVKVNNKTLDAANYAFAEGTLTLANTIFTKQGVYTVTVEAEGYTVANMKLPVYAADLANENWTVKWEDQFNGTELDTTKWSYETGIRSGDDASSDAPIYWGNNEKQYYTKEAVEVKDGYLVITGDELTQEVKDQYGVTDTTVAYTSGRIRTVTDEGEVLAATTYGRIEAKMSLPAGDGYWPAFWMLPTQDGIDAYGTWASSGELDIMEAVGQNPTQVNGTIHYGGQWPNNVYSGGTYTFPGDSTIAEEHLYAVEWEPGEIRWYVDDVLYHVENNWYGMDANGEKYTYPAPYDEDFYILFNLAMSGNYVSNVLPTEMGKQLKVDYVRILVDENEDYDDSNVTAPSADRDSEFFEDNGGYVDLIVDKDFETLKDHAFGDGANVIPGIGYWSSAVNTGAGAQATVEVVDGVAKYDVTKVGANNYNIQLIQNIPLAKGYTYRITFDAWTDLATGREIVVAPKGDADNSWATYDAGINAALTTEKKTFTYDFVMKADSDPTARLEMNLGGATGTVYVDNVSVIALTDDQIENPEEGGANEPLPDGEHVYNGSFDKGNGRLGNWITEGTKGSTENRDYTVTVGEEGAKLIQEGVELLEEDEYKITFDAKVVKAGLLRTLFAADEPNIRVSLTDAAGTTVLVSEEFVLTSEMETYELTFTVPAGLATDFGRLVFEFLGTGDTISLDNVSMERLTDIHMDWDAYEFYPIGKGSEALEGFETYDEVWTWTENPIAAEDLGNGEMGFAVRTTPASENWKVMLQRADAVLAKGMTYRIQYAIKASVADQPVEVKIEDGNYAPCYDENLTVGTEWTYVDTTFTSTLAGNGGLKFCLAGVDQECTIYVKDVMIVMEGIPTPQFVAGSEVSQMTVGSTVKLNVEYSVKVKDEYNSFTYASSDDSVVAVAADGTMTAKKEGTATITVTSVLGTAFTFDVTVVKSSGAGNGGGNSGGNTNINNVTNPISPKTADAGNVTMVVLMFAFASAMAAVVAKKKETK